MKALLIAAVLLVSSTGFSARNSNPEESHFCSASLIFLNGTFNEVGRVECRSPFAGKCLKQNPKNPNGWDIVDKSECDSRPQE